LILQQAIISFILKSFVMLSHYSSSTTSVCLFLFVRSIMTYVLRNTVPLQEPKQTHSLRKFLTLEPTSFYNISQICTHFLKEVDEFQNSSLQAEDVMALIKTNLRSLELRKVDNLSKITPYYENPSQIQFFRLFLRQLISEWKSDLFARVYKVK
jgi:hypothetical protein